MNNFHYEEETNQLSFKNWRGNFTATPIYLIRCTCWQPIKAYFSGKTPYSKFDMDKMGFGDQHSRGEYYRLITHGRKGWGFWLCGTYGTCPNCNSRIYIGGNAKTAIENYVRSKLAIKDSIKLDDSRIELLKNTIQSQSDVQQFLACRKDSLSDRTDTALVVNIEQNRYGFKELRKSLKLQCEHEEYWIDGSAENSQEHYDLEADIIAAHGEECTCGLCME